MADLNTNLDQRLPAIRTRDVILAALQAAFSADNLIGDGVQNPYLFVPGDPSKSAVWVTTPQGRDQYTGRDGRRNMITVSRGDYVPQDLHLQNTVGMNFSDRHEYSDLGSTMLMVQCEAGNETQSEVLASICYSVLKLFRPQLMEDYDIHNFKLLSITSPIRMEDAPGAPWLTIVNLRLEVQEFATMVEVANRLNRLDISTALQEQTKTVIASLDATPPAASP